MMKIILYISLMHCLFSCNSKIEKNCVINKEFKIHFFECIDNIESYTLKEQNTKGEFVNLEMFKTSLNKISNYVEIDFPFLANYEIGFTSKEEYYKSKTTWLKWYEDNKCKNLQWKE